MPKKIWIASHKRRFAWLEWMQRYMSGLCVKKAASARPIFGLKRRFRFLFYYIVLFLQIQKFIYDCYLSNSNVSAGNGPEVIFI